MGKHQLVECPRCQLQVGVTHLEAAYGCRRCKVSLTPEQRQQLHRARIAHNRLLKTAERDSQARRLELQARYGKPDALDREFAELRAQRGGQTPTMAEREATEEAFFRSEVAKLEKDFTELLRSVGRLPPRLIPPVAPSPPAARGRPRNVTPVQQQITELTARTVSAPSASVPTPRESAPARPVDFIPTYQGQPVRPMKQLIAAADYARSVDNVMAAHRATIVRCACCEVCWHAGEPPFEETFDAKYLCRHCAYGVLRCGACPLHRNVIYPEIAAKVPRIHPRDYPPEVLVPFDASAFE